MPGNHTIKGFGLIEILVGLAIGTIASVIMLQALALSERQKRTTTGASDVQSNGAISLITVERDIKMAGWGMQGDVFSGCTEFFTYDTTTGGAIDTNTTPGSSLVSVVSIVDGDTSPDTITIRHYDDPSSQDFRFSVATLTTAQATADADFTLTSVKGCKANDLIIASNSTQCTLAQVSSVDTATNKVSHAAGTGMRYNAPDLTLWPVHGTSSRIQCIPGFFERTYSVDTAKRQLNLSLNGTSYAVAPEILDLQAEYGVDKSTGLPGIDWVPATGLEWTSPDIAHIRRIKGVRIAILARSASYEKPEPGTACSATDTAMIAGMSTWAKFDTSAFPDDWQCYRYKAFEINVPLRNILWSRSS
jgi:type IV pilus assembly protein PilW